jgi:WD40 repeat protein
MNMKHDKQSAVDTQFEDTLPDIHQVRQFEAVLRRDVHASRKTLPRQSRVALWVAVMLLIAACAATIFWRRDTNQSTLAPVNSLEGLVGITSENIEQLEPLVTLGRGAISNIALSPDGNTLAVASTTGLYLQSTDLSRPPRLLGGQTQAVSSPSYSRDGTRIAGVRDNVVVVWDAQTGQVLRQITTGDEFVIYTAFNRSEDRLVIGACRQERSERANYCTPFILRFYDATTYNEQSSIEVPLPYRAVLSPDWSLVVAGDEDTIQLIRVATGDVLAEIPFPGETASPVFAFNSTGTELMVGRYFGNVLHVFDVAELIVGNVEPLEPTTGSRIPSWSYVTFLPDDERILTISGSSYIVIYDADTGERISTGTMVLDIGYVLAVDISSDGETLYMAGADGGLYKWNLSTLRVVQEAHHNSGGVHYAAFSVDRHYLVTGGASWSPTGGNYLWHIDSLPPTNTPIHVNTANQMPGYVSSAAFSPDGNKLVVVSNGSGDYGELYQYEFSSSQLSLYSTTRRGFTQAVAYTSDGVLLSHATADVLFRWSSRDEPERFRLTLPPLSPTGTVSNFGDVVFSPDGRLLAKPVCLRDEWGAVCKSIRVVLYDTATGEPRIVLDPQVNDLSSGGRGKVSFSADGQVLAQSLCFEPDNTLVDGVTVVSCLKAGIQLFDISAAYGEANAQEPITPFATIEGYNYPPEAFAFAPQGGSGAWLLAAPDPDNSRLTIWQVDASGASSILYTFELTARWANITAIAFSPDGELMALSYNGKLELWGVRD